MKPHLSIPLPLPLARSRGFGLLLAWMLLAFWLTGAQSATTPSDRRGEVQFQPPRGFFESPVTVSLTHKPGAILRFTLDGTTPSTTNGMVYDRPIRVDHTTVILARAFDDNGRPEGPARASTYLFLNDILRQSPDGLPPVGWPFRWGPNRVDYGMDPRVVDHPSYKDEIRAGFRSIPTYSIVMDLDDLFHPATGIYSNADAHGREMERPCSVEMISGQGGPGFQANAGIRIRGGFSRRAGNPKHSFRVLFRKEYGDGKLKFPVFGPEGPRSFDGFDFRTSQNYSWSMGGDPRAVFFRDQLNRDLQLAMGQPAARGHFCHLYINGQYWGLYDTCERPEASFAASHFGGEKEEYDVIKARGAAESQFGPLADPPFATDGNRHAWRQLWEGALENLAQTAPYQRLLGNNPDGSRNPAFPVLLDPVNLTDYMLVIFYGGNMDAPISKFGANNMPNNWYGIRSRNGSHGFRFFIWDAEHTFLDPDEDRTGPFNCGELFEQSNPQYLFQRCLENAEFRLLVADRIQKHLFGSGVLTPRGVRNLLLQRAREIEQAVICESARWGDSREGFSRRGYGQAGPRTRDDDWRREVRRITEEYLPQRTDILFEQLWSLGLWPSVDPPQAVSSTGGRISLSAPNGVIRFTTDGSDPRQPGGAPAPAALTYTQSVTVPAGKSLKARAYLKDDWSALIEVTPR